MISGYIGDVTWYFWVKNHFVYVFGIELHISCYRFFRQNKRVNLLISELY